MSVKRQAMVAVYFAGIQRSISAERFSPYINATAAPLDAAVIYYWNIALAEALYPTLAAFEIALRNTIHDSLTARQGGDEFWFRAVLAPAHLREYAGTHARLIENGVANPTAGKIVSELKFWIWTQILSSLYHSTLWAPNRTALLLTAFPNLPRIPNNRHYVYERCNDIRMLRNRVMHHEPIWQGMKFQRKRAPRATYTIEALHARIDEAIGWINPELQRSIRQFDRFGEVFTNGRAGIEQRIRVEFGL